MKPKQALFFFLAVLIIGYLLGQIFHLTIKNGRVVQDDKTEAKEVPYK